MNKSEEKEQKRLAKLEAERARTEAMKEFEYKYAEFKLICGIDEVGRGPFAGPVVAGAVILPKDEEILYLNDSKKLSEKKREELYNVIMDKAVAVGLGYESNEVIDEINIKKATHRAMKKAIEDLKNPKTGEKYVPDFLFVDAEHIPDVDIKQIGIIKGDAKSVSIAAASIIAKVTRDRLMVEYDRIYPGYDFASNKGYGTAAHMAAIRELGMTPIHRKTFVHL
ncbi:MAG: ribonuclease HII [Lachnospiraceae bacterium]|nr:ribonuclease HII [Lachnospiraceae bacterium]